MGVTPTQLGNPGDRSSHGQEPLLECRKGVLMDGAPHACHEEAVVVMVVSTIHKPTGREKKTK